MRAKMHRRPELFWERHHRITFIYVTACWAPAHQSHAREVPRFFFAPANWFRHHGSGLQVCIATVSNSGVILPILSASVPADTANPLQAATVLDGSRHSPPGPEADPIGRMASGDRGRCDLLRGQRTVAGLPPPGSPNFSTCVLTLTRQTLMAPVLQAAWAEAIVGWIVGSACVQGAGAATACPGLPVCWPRLPVLLDLPFPFFLR